MTQSSYLHLLFESMRSMREDALRILQRMLELNNEDWEVVDGDSTITVDQVLRKMLELNVDIIDVIIFIKTINFIPKGILIIRAVTPTIFFITSSLRKIFT